MHDFNSLISKKDGIQRWGIQFGDCIGPESRV